MSTPLYKSLNQNGMTTYALPGVQADISQTYQNDRYKKRFTHFVLLNLPRQNVSGVGRDVFDFNTQLETFAPLLGTDYAVQLVNALRNYTANRDEVFRLSKVSSTEYFYDQSNLRSVSERNFFRLLQKTGVIQFDIARGPDTIIPNGQSLDWIVDESDVTGVDSYYSLKNHNLTISEQQSNYYPEVLWRERESKPFTVLSFSNDPLNTSVLRIVVDVDLTSNFVMNLKVGDWLVFEGTHLGIPTSEMSYLGLTGESIKHQVTAISGFSGKYMISIDVSSYSGTFLASNVSGKYSSATVRLDYQRVVQYIGEISGSGSITTGNTSETNILAIVPEEHGSTPVVLFRTLSDSNYRPGINLPILPNEYSQYVIKGAESPDHPFNIDPDNEIGSKYAYYDVKSTSRFQYSIATGDVDRMTGDFYGVDFDFNVGVEFTPETIDGIAIDFNRAHYAGMNDTNVGVLDTFNQYNALSLNNEPPKSFEFNAILWFYEIKDTATNESSVNLYGISFLDHPDNDCGSSDTLIPPVKKLTPGEARNATSFSFNLRQGFVVSGDVIPVYDPEASYTLRDYNIYTEVLQELVDMNTNFESVINSNALLSEEIALIKQLLYTQTDINLIKNQINNLNNLLNLYSTLQIQSTDSIEVMTDTTVSPSVVKLNTKGSHVESHTEITTTSMYDVNFSRIIPRVVSVMTSKDFVILLDNNDVTNLSLPSRLKLVLDKDLNLNQTLKVYVYSTVGLEDKGIDIEIKDRTGSIVSGVFTPISESMVSLPLPVRYNGITTSIESYPFRSKMMPITLIDDVEVLITPEIELVVTLRDKYSSSIFKAGDWIELRNMDYMIQADLAGNDLIERSLSGQHLIKTVDNSGLTTKLIFDFENNQAMSDLISQYNAGVLAGVIGYSSLGAIPVSWFDLLTKYPIIDSIGGWLIELTRVSNISGKEYMTQIQKLHNYKIS